MERREFMTLMSLLFVGCQSSTTELTGNPMSNDNSKDIIIVGAGLASLVAAKQLQAKGFNVTVLEAQDRIGGRIWTSNQWSDLAVDLGATWIHTEDGNPLAEIARSLDASLLSTSYDSVVTYNSNGNEVTNNEQELLNTLTSQIQTTLKIAQDIQSNDTSLKETLTTLRSSYAHDSNEYKFINFILSSLYEQEYTGSIDELSTLYFDHIKEFEGGDLLFVDGFKVIIDYLASGLNIKTEEVVQEIDWGDSNNKIVTQNRTYSADYVVVTVPLGVLQAQDITFTPTLPKDKQEAIDSLGMGVLNKCYLEFETVFWEQNVDWIEYIPESSNYGEWTQWISFAQAAKKPVLLGFNSAKRGEEIESWRDEEIIESAMKTLRTIYGENIPNPKSHQITRWKSEPYVKGAYSYNKVGSTPSMRDTLAQSLDNKLFFAGEATSKYYFGTAHGAYLSGISVVKSVLEIDKAL